MRKRIWPALLLLLIASPLLADTPDGTLRIFVSSANPTGSWSGDIDIGGPVVPAEVEAQSATGFGIVYEVRLGKRWGVESGLYFTDFDFEIEAMGENIDFGSALAIPLAIGADFHVHSGERIDFYLGPLISYTFWGNLDTPLGEVKIDGDFGFGAVVGLDVRLGRSGWTLGLGARYLQMALSDPTVDVDVDPLFVELGIGYRF